MLMIIGNIILCEVPTKTQLTNCQLAVWKNNSALALYKDFVFILTNLAPYVRQRADEQSLHTYRTLTPELN